MKFYLMTDLEGVAGVYQWENRDDASRENHERRMRQRRWLAEEVNAAIEGFYAGGGTEIMVNDGHGAGYTIDLDYLDPRARVLNGRDRQFWMPYLDETCQATGLLGAHAKAGTKGGCLYHTMSLEIRNWTFNGISLGEAGLQAAIAGHYGVPFIFLSGDAYACREMEELIPGIVTVPVKVGLGRQSALHCTLAQSRELIREGAEYAWQVLGEVAPFRLEGPILFRDERVEPTFDEENPPPHSRIIDAHTREIEGADIIDLVYKIYPSYPRGLQPLEFTPAWKR